MYSKAKLPNDKGFITRTLTLERRVLTGSLPTIPAIHPSSPGIDWNGRLVMWADTVRSWSEKSTPRMWRLSDPQIDRQASPAKHAPLDHIRLCGKRVDISLPAIRRYLYDENVDATRTPLTAEFGYWWRLVKYVQFLHEPELRETTKRPHQG